MFVGVNSTSPIFNDISDTNRYNGEVGDVVVGRIKEVSPVRKRTPN